MGFCIFEVVREMVKLSETIFKAYDIRGIVGKTIDSTVAYQIGQAFGKEVRLRGESSVVIGRDGRLSGPELAGALSLGVQSTGLEVIDLGQVTTPIVYFATAIGLAKSGIAITGSHNPPDYNGFKLVLSGRAIYGDDIKALYYTIVREDFIYGQGSSRQENIHRAYVERISADIRVARPIKIVVDCGNGVAGAFAADVFRAIGCEVIELFCTVDGTFPNHHPDPAHIENLQDVIHALQTSDAELGLAFDGDGDRLGVVTKEGQIIYPDRQLMLFAADVLKRHPGREILYDVKCTANLSPWIKAHHGVPVMCKTGHSLVKARMLELDAPLGGEMSGHLFFKDRWYGFDDGLYAGARLLELLSLEQDPSAVLNALPQSLSTPELQVQLEEGENFSVIAQIQAQALFPSGVEPILIDGLRLEYPDGFGLVRASNTTPVLVLRFEAQNQAALLRIQTDFKQMILAVKSDVILPF
jgi:phosphomannomutase/phosphoglucomutase